LLWILSVAQRHLADDMEKSCAILGFYLANWGMFRGSSPLLKKSYYHYNRLIRFVDKKDASGPSFIDLDVPDYCDQKSRERIKKRAEDINN
jgi:hypothetical protein